MGLIKQQRLAFLVEGIGRFSFVFQAFNTFFTGTRFTKYSPRGQRIKDKFWYMRLSPNHKVLHYGDCDEKSAPSTEELQSKLAVSDIRALLVGRDCPHMKGRKASYQLAFSLALEGKKFGYHSHNTYIIHYFFRSGFAVLGLCGP